MDKNRKDAAKGIFFILQIGLNMIVTLGIGFGIGYLLAWAFKLDWLILVGLLLGAIAGYRNIYDMVIGFTKNKEKPKDPGPTEQELFRKRAEQEFSEWKENKNSNE